jgi:hypothetical protein
VSVLASSLRQQRAGSSVNHSPKFAPVLHPTLETGVEAMVVGALAWLDAA